MLASCCASISGTTLIFDIEEYVPISNTVIFDSDIEVPRNEKWQISGICEPPDIEESSILNVKSSSVKPWTASKYMHQFEIMFKYQQLIIVWTIIISRMFHVLCSGIGVELHLPFAFNLSLNCAGVLFFVRRVLKSPCPSKGSQLIVYSLQLRWVTIHINY